MWHTPGEWITFQALEKVMAHALFLNKVVWRWCYYYAPVTNCNFCNVMAKEIT